MEKIIEKITQLELKKQNHICEHNSIVNKEGWGTGKIKRVYIKKIKHEIKNLIKEFNKTKI